jgi:hypothetical protein
MLSSAWPITQIIYDAPDHLIEIIRFYATAHQKTVEHFAHTQLNDLKNTLQDIDFFYTERMMLVTGTLTQPQTTMLNQLAELLPETYCLWLITTNKKSSLSWPQIYYQRPSATLLERLFPHQSENLLSLDDNEILNDPLMILQLLQQSRLCLPLNQSIQSSFEGSCWDLLQKLMNTPSYMELSLEQIAQLSFALEMIHQAASLPHYNNNFYLPIFIKKLVMKTSIRTFIDTELLGCYQKILEATLNSDKKSAQYFTHLWIKYFAQQAY